uniref:Homeobox domain-containing protein n=1 Tax=Panagrolaimus sp. JU765 TaxID=591449 RepID=A0AC34QSK8_9BILA
MATMVIPSAVSEWQHEAERQAAELCAKVLAVEQEKENGKIDQIENCSSPPMEEKSKTKVEPISDFMRKKFETLVEERSCNIYPTRNEKEEIAQLLDASYSQINRLFANHRRRILKKKATPQTEIREASIERLMAKIKEPSLVVTPGEVLLHEETSTSERSVSPTGSFSETDESVAVICAQVADQIHDDIQEKKNLMQPEKREKQPRKKRAPKRKISEHDAKLEATVDEILSKVSREEIDAEREQQGKPLFFDLSSIVSCFDVKIN